MVTIIEKWTNSEVRAVKRFLQAKDKCSTETHDKHVSFYVFMLAAGETTCPKEVDKAIGECMGILQKDMARSNGMHLFMSVLDQTSELCSQDKLHKMFACLHKVYDQCAQSKEGAETAGIIIDPVRWEKTITDLCNSQGVIRANKQCEAKAKVEFQECSNRETIAITQQIMHLRDLLAQPEYSSMANKQRLHANTDIACLYTLKIQDCLRKPYEKYCPKKMADLLDNAIETFMLPGCSTRFSQMDPPARSHHEPNYDRVDNGYNNPHINEDGDFIRDENVIVGTGAVDGFSAEDGGPAYRSNGVFANEANSGGSGNVASSGRGRAPPLMGQAGKVTRDDSNGAKGVIQGGMFRHGMFAIAAFASLVAVVF